LLFLDFFKAFLYFFNFFTLLCIDNKKSLIFPGVLTVLFPTAKFLRLLNNSCFLISFSFEVYV